MSIATIPTILIANTIANIPAATIPAATIPSRLSGLSAECLRRTCAAAEKRLYEQEIALHDAHQSHVEFWIHTAEVRLHFAVVEYEATRSMMSKSAQS